LLDLHALTDTTGNTSLTNISVAANIPSLDGQTAPGVPIAPGAVLKGWGVYSTIADTLAELQLTSQDQVDSINGEHWLTTAGSVLGLVHFDAFLPYKSGGRNIAYKQNTGAAPVIAYTLDQYSGPSGAQISKLGQRIILPQVFSGALTANKWGSQVVNPLVQIPAGRYAILGAYCHNMTNYGLVRFTHADFGGKKPGFPVVDPSKAVTRAVAPMNESVFNLYGRQFMALGDIPTFNATSAGTGLTIEMLNITADTPTVNLNIVQVGS
jgi:hypothetical protein